MLIDKKRKFGKKISDLQIGDSYTTSHIMEDRDLLLYLGLTKDANPLYIQHDYASQTPCNLPIVPSVMLFGMVSSVVSMHLPGPGSHIIQHEMKFKKSVYHNSEVKLTIEIIAIDHENHHVTLSLIGYDVEGDEVINGKLLVVPPISQN